MTLMTKTLKKTVLGSFDMVIELLTLACCHTDVVLAWIHAYMQALQMLRILSDNLGMCWLIKLRKYDPIEAYAFAHFMCTNVHISRVRRANKSGNTQKKYHLLVQLLYFYLYFLSLNLTSFLFSVGCIHSKGQYTKFKCHL